MKRFALGLLFLAGSLAGCTSPTGNESSSASADTEGSTALAAAQKIAGHYTGASTAYRVDEHGDVVKAYTFHEDITAAPNPEMKDGRVFVHVTDTITGLPAPKTWTEGFFVNPDGSLGARYYRMDDPGAVDIVETPLASDGANAGATFQTDLYPGEENALGFGGKDIVYKKHTTVKNTVVSGNIETDIIARVTTISWRDASGAIQTRSFTSMNGYQSRTIGPAE